MRYIDQLVDIDSLVVYRFACGIHSLVVFLFACGLLIRLWYWFACGFIVSLEVIDPLCLLIRLWFLLFRLCFFLFRLWVIGSLAVYWVACGFYWFACGFISLGFWLLRVLSGFLSTNHLISIQRHYTSFRFLFVVVLSLILVLQEGAVSLLTDMVYFVS